MNKLTIELVPRSAWYTNVRSNVTRLQWDNIRMDCYAKAGFKCEICDQKRDSKHTLEAHEEFTYDDVLHTQTLTKVIALCNKCHTAKHPGLAQIKGKMEVVYAQLEKVNGMDYDQINAYLDACFALWKLRSKHEWKLDISLIDSYLK